MVATQGVPLRRRISLRLDDGTIISGCQKHAKSEAVVCLRPEQAYESGFLHEADLIKVQSLLCEVHARLPEVGPLRSVSTGTKRSLDSVLEVGQATSGKRSRSTAGVVAPANGIHDTAAAGAAAARLDSPASVPPPPPAPAAPAAPPAADPGVVSLGMGIINKIIKMLGKDSYVFAAPVDVRYVPDYYDIIKTPICLNEIRERLQQGAHFTAASMYEDFYLLISNCFTYNKTGTNIHILGQRIEKLFNAELRKAGHGHLVRNIKKQPRVASRAGNRAGGLDEDDDDDDYKPSASKRGASQRAPAPGGPKAAKSRQGGGARPAKAPGGVPVGVARTKSVNSYKAFQPLPEDKQAELAEALSNEEVLAAKMEGVVEILQRANELGASEDGEVELDLTVLSPQTVWQLYEFIFGVQRAPEQAQQAQQQQQRSGSGFQLEQDSDYDPLGEESDD